MNILDTLKPSQRALVKTKDYKKDTILFREFDECKEIGIVINGSVSIVSYLNDGKEIIYNTIEENGIFGNNLVFSSVPYYKGNIITNVDSKIAYISHDILIKLLKNNEAFLIEYQKIQSDFAKALNNTIKMLSIDSAEEKLYFYLHENNGKIKYDSITQLSKQLYMQRETLSRLISKLLKQKKIKKDNNTISIL